MKVRTGLLVGVAMLASGAAEAQYYTQASVSGVVLSEGPLGFMLQGPDGNYGIQLNQTTVVTDSWNTVVVTGAGNSVQPGDFITATGYPTSQWIMQASRIVVRNVTQPYGANYGTGGGSIITPNNFAPLQQGVPNFNTLPAPFNNNFSALPTPFNNNFNTLPMPFNNTFNALPTPFNNSFNPFAARSFSRR